jgi:hypothetical protein
MIAKIGVKDDRPFIKEKEVLLRQFLKDGCLAYDFSLGTLIALLF